jgi:hypothetical protein
MNRNPARSRTVRKHPLIGQPRHRVIGRSGDRAIGNLRAADHPLTGSPERKRTGRPRFGFAALPWIFAFVLFIGGPTFAQEDDPVGPDKSVETRYSLSVTDEGTAYPGLRAAAPQDNNLFLLQPTFGYRHGERWRFFSSVAGLAQSDGETHTQLRVRETYVDISAADFDFTVGKRLVRWGTGYAFTATGVLDPPRVSTDPTDRLSLNEGREMAQVDWTSGPHRLTLAWASAGLFQPSPGLYDTTALRYNVMVHGFDTSLIVSHDRGGTSLGGGNFSRVFGSAWELHGELAWREKAAALIGGKYTTGAGVTTTVEFYSPPNTRFYQPVAMPPSAGRQYYSYLRIGKNRLRELPGWKQWDVTVSLVTNLSDQSRVGVLDVTRRIGGYFSTYLHAETPGGDRWRSQYGTIPYSARISLGIRFQL